MLDQVKQNNHSLRPMITTKKEKELKSLRMEHLAAATMRYYGRPRILRSVDPSNVRGSGGRRWKYDDD